MQIDEAMKRVRPDLGFEKSYFALGSVFPKFTIQIGSVPRVARVVFKPGWIANRINKKRIALGHAWVGGEVLEKSYYAECAFRFVAVDGCENADANRFTSTFWAEKYISGE